MDYITIFDGHLRDFGVSCYLPPTGMNWTADNITALATGYWQSAALIGAVELGVFDHLDQPRMPEYLAKQCGANETLLISLLNALVAIELLDKSADGYAIATGAKTMLSRSSPTCMIDALRYNADLYQQWGKLSEVIRTGQPAVEQSRQLGSDPAMTRRFVYGMESKARAFVTAIAPMINLGNAKTLLDVGSGPGTLSRTLAEQNDTLEVTLLDLPDVLAVAREICTASNAAKQLKYHPADYRAAALPMPFDAILYAGALHQETLQSASHLITRFYESVLPGGTVYLVDLMLDDCRTAPTFSTLFQITMMLMRPSARVFSNAEIISLLVQAGFVAITTQQATSSPYRLVTARKSEK